MESREEPLDSPDVGALADPVRRRLYEHIASTGRPMRRDEAAEAAGIARPLAAYHLDRLVKAGLLSTSYARPDGAGGPGAGRPAKHYEPVHDEVSVTVPPRTYGLLAQMLADAAMADRSGAVRSALMATAEREGRSAACEEADLLTALRGRGYDPRATGSGDVDLHNCPFHQAARDHQELVCGLNHALIRGYLSERGDDPARAELRPRPGRCCVVLHPDTAQRR